MIRSAQNTTKKLLIEDSGIAMPISLLVFLFLTFVCMSVFALGEVIRARTELQYKVDNAAYAAALVQADSLSRIAVLNRALAWTYAQTNKRQMDYIVSRWLTESYDAFIEDADQVAALHYANSQTACINHRISIPENKRLHTTEYNYGKTDVLYGVTKEIGIDTLKSLVASSVAGGALPGGKIIHGIFEEGTNKNAIELQKAVDVLRPALTILQDDIKVGSDNIHTMNEQIKEIQDNLPSRIYLAVTEILGKNNNGLTVGVGEYWYKENQKKPTWFTIPDSWNEFKSRYIVNSDPDSWGEKGWWAPVKGKDGIKHSYVGNFQLQWQPYYVGWSCQPDKHIHVPVINFPRTVSTGMSPDGTPWGNICDGVLWNHSPKVNPAKLIPGFFGKEGSIVVAAKAPIPDLFGNVFGKNKFLNFRVDGNLWAVSAARAGYRNGEKYENSKFLNEEQWNLFEDDWEPMFLPVGRCWKSWDGEKFTGDDAYKVLEAVADNLDIDISENGLKLNEKVNLDVLH